MIRWIAPTAALTPAALVEIIRLARRTLIPPNVPRSQLNPMQFRGFARLAVIAMNRYPGQPLAVATGRLGAEVLGAQPVGTATSAQLGELAAVAAELAADRVDFAGLAGAYQEAQATAGQPKPRVTEYVPGLYQNTDPDMWPPGWQFDDTVNEHAAGTTVYASVDRLQGGMLGGRTNIKYNPATGRLSSNELFLERVHGPRWVPTTPPLVDGRGTPLQTYLQMRAMRKLNVKLADLRTVAWEKVVNTPTVLGLGRAAKNGVPQDQAVRESYLGKLAENAITQSGGRITGARLVGGSQIVAEVRGDSADVLAEYGVDANDQLLSGFNLEIDVAPGLETAAGLFFPGVNDTADHVKAAKQLPKLDNFVVVVGQGVDGGIELSDGSVLPAERIAEQLAGKNVVLAVCNGDRLAADLLAGGVNSVLAPTGMVWFIGGGVKARRMNFTAQGKPRPGMSTKPAKWVLRRRTGEPVVFTSDDLIEILNNEELPAELRQAAKVVLDPDQTPERPVHFSGASAATDAAVANLRRLGGSAEVARAVKLHNWSGLGSGLLSRWALAGPDAVLHLVRVAREVYGIAPHDADGVDLAQLANVRRLLDLVAKHSRLAGLRGWRDVTPDDVRAFVQGLPASNPAATDVELGLVADLVGVAKKLTPGRRVTPAALAAQLNAHAAGISFTTSRTVSTETVERQRQQPEPEPVLISPDSPPGSAAELDRFLDEVDALLRSAPDALPLGTRVNLLIPPSAGLLTPAALSRLDALALRHGVSFQAPNADITTTTKATTVDWVSPADAAVTAAAANAGRPAAPTGPAPALARAREQVRQWHAELGARLVAASPVVVGSGASSLHTTWAEIEGKLGSPALTPTEIGLLRGELYRLERKLAVAEHAMRGRSVPLQAAPGQAPVVSSPDPGKAQSAEQVQPPGARASSGVVQQGTVIAMFGQIEAALQGQDTKAAAALLAQARTVANQLILAIATRAAPGEQQALYDRLSGLLADVTGRGAGRAADRRYG